MVRAACSQLSWGGEPDAEVANDSWMLSKKKLLHVPQPPAGGCPINSLPPEILSYIFVLGHQMYLDQEPSHTTDPGSDSGHEQDDLVPLHRNTATLTALSDHGAAQFPTEPIPVIDDQNNSDWEDEDSDEDLYIEDGLSVESVLVDDSLQVTVSHVCAHWRGVALDTPALWSEIDLETGRHAGPSLRRASTYLSRTKEYPLSISIDVNQWPPDDESVDSEQSDDQSPETSAQIRGIMDLLLPHASRWRNFKLTAEVYFHFHTILGRLCDARPALLLESLELHHFDEELEPEPYFFPHPHHKTPFVLFGNHAPSLRHVSLYGVHIDWHNTTFLKNLHSLELSYLSQDVRPSFDRFFTILRSSLELRTLELTMAGPSNPHEWPTFLPPPPQNDHYHDPHVPTAFVPQSHALDEYMILPKLHELRLSYQSPEELVAFFDRVSMPSLHTLEINFEDHQYTDFIQSHLVDPPKWQGGSSRDPRLTNLKELRITQLPCTPAAIANLYAALVNLETIDFDFNCLDETFWEVLVEEHPGIKPPRLLLPALHTMKVKGSSGSALRQIVGARIQVGLPLKKLVVDLASEIELEDDEWLRERVEGIEYYEGSDDDYTDDDESVSSSVDDAFPFDALLQD